MLIEPCDAPTDCALAECECQEINQGRALHVPRARRFEARERVRPALVDPSGRRARQSCARRPPVPRLARNGASGPFVEIAEVADTTFDDTAADGERLIYDVTPVW
jgi:hypothetical protein